MSLTGWSQVSQGDVMQLELTNHDVFLFFFNSLGIEMLNVQNFLEKKAKYRGIKHKAPWNSVLNISTKTQICRVIAATLLGTEVGIYCYYVSTQAIPSPQPSSFPFCTDACTAGGQELERKLTAPEDLGVTPGLCPSTRLAVWGRPLRL